MDVAKDCFKSGLKLLDAQIGKCCAEIKGMKVGQPKYDETVGRCAILKVAQAKALAAVQWIDRL